MSIKPSVYCTKCGAQSDVGTKFCSVCGNDLYSGNQSNNTNDINNKQELAIPENIIFTGNEDKQNLKTRMNDALEDGRWGEALVFAERIITTDAEDGEGYLGGLLAECRISNIDLIAEKGELLSKSKYYKGFLKYAEAELVDAVIININKSKELQGNKIVEILYSLIECFKTLKNKQNEEKSIEQVLKNFKSNQNKKCIAGIFAAIFVGLFVGLFGGLCFLGDWLGLFTGIFVGFIYLMCVIANCKARTSKNDKNQSEYKTVLEEEQQIISVMAPFLSCIPVVSRSDVAISEILAKYNNTKSGDTDEDTSIISLVENYRGNLEIIDDKIKNIPYEGISNMSSKYETLPELKKIIGSMKKNNKSNLFSYFDNNENNKVNMINGNNSVKKCRSCGAPLDDDALFCIKCGTKIEQQSKVEVVSEKKKVIFCSACGTKLDAGTKFCTKCGYKL